MKMKKSIIRTLFLLPLFTFAFSFQTIACPYKNFETCISEIGKELPPELKPFIEKQCEALGCRTPLNPLSNLVKEDDENNLTYSKNKSSKTKKIICKNKLSS